MLCALFAGRVRPLDKFLFIGGIKKLKKNDTSVDKTDKT